MKFTDDEIKEFLMLFEAGAPLPEKWRSWMFLESGGAAEVGKEYRLVYDGKMRLEEALVQTPRANLRDNSLPMGLPGISGFQSRSSKEDLSGKISGLRG